VSTVYSQHLRELAEPNPEGDCVKTAIERAAKRAGLHYWRTFDIWYGKARRIDAHEALQISEAVQKKRDDEARNELNDLRTRLLKMESRLASQDPDFHRETIDLLRLQTRGPGGMGRPVDRRK